MCYIIKNRKRRHVNLILPAVWMFQTVATAPSADSFASRVPKLVKRVDRWRHRAGLQQQQVSQRCDGRLRAATEAEWTWSQDAAERCWQIRRCSMPASLQLAAAASQRYPQFNKDEAIVMIRYWNINVCSKAGTEPKKKRKSFRKKAKTKITYWYAQKRW